MNSVYFFNYYRIHFLKNCTVSIPVVLWIFFFFLINFPVSFPILLLSVISSSVYKIGSTIGILKSTEYPDFASNLFFAFVYKEPSQNVVFSHMPIHACLTLAYDGAEGQSAKDMRKVLNFPDGDKELVLEKSISSF